MIDNVQSYTIRNITRRYHTPVYCTHRLSTELAYFWTPPTFHPEGATMADQSDNQPQANDGEAAAAAAGAAVPAGLTPEELARILPTDKDKIAEWVLQQEQLLETLKLRSATIADVVVFRGYLQSINEPIVGKDANGNPIVTGQKHVLSRLYFDLEFNEYIEFPREDLIHTIPLVNRSFPLSGVV